LKAMYLQFKLRTVLFTAICLLALPYLAHSQNYCGTDPVAVHGALSVKGTKIVDQHNEVVSFAGMSFFWSNDTWEGERFYTPGVVSWLEKDWNASIVRAAVGVDRNGGYIESPESNKAKAKTIVDAAIENGLYVIIDWHSHHAEDHLEESIAFFEEMARTYGDYPNVIYEIYNEPLQISWPDIIKPYSEAVVAAIRAIDPDNLIIIGSSTWSQDVDVASEDPIVGYDNLAYTLHFYAGTHGAYLREKAEKAMSNGLAIMCTEWGSVNADGDGLVDLVSTQAWMEFLKAHDITHLNWSICDKVEGASIVKPGASLNGNWSDDDLTASGLKVKSLIKGWKQYCEE